MKSGMISSVLRMGVLAALLGAATVSGHDLYPRGDCKCIAEDDTISTYDGAVIVVGRVCYIELMHVRSGPCDSLYIYLCMYRYNGDLKIKKVVVSYHDHYAFLLGDLRVGYLNGYLPLPYTGTHLSIGFEFSATSRWVILKITCGVWCCFDGNIVWLHWVPHCSIHGACGDCDGNANDDYQHNGINYNTNPSSWLSHYEVLCED